MVKGQYHTDENCTNPSEDALQILEGQETLAGLKVKCSSGINHLVSTFMSLFEVISICSILGFKGSQSYYKPFCL